MHRFVLIPVQVVLLLDVLCLVGGDDWSSARTIRSISYSSLPLQIIPIPSSLIPQTNVTIQRADTDARLPRDAFALTSTEPWSVITPDPRNDPPLQRTSIQAARHYHQCDYATNGGPFHSDGSNVGAVVSNGRIVNDNFDGVGFGMGRRPETDELHWVIGTVASVAHARELGLQQFVTGFDWLVYNGINVVGNNTTGAEQAPRTAIGVTQHGSLILLVTDGCERCWDRRGLRLTELAAVLIRLGTWFAINLDGGGSSVLIVRNHTLSRPTCLDVLPIVCERPVASVVCVGGSDHIQARSQSYR